jgi:predicted deacylase
VPLRTRIIAFITLSVFFITACVDYTVPFYRSGILGASVKGNPVEMSWFGSGREVIVVIAGVHGDEQNTVVTARYLLERLESGQITVPDSKSVLLIPVLNPDGIAAGTRENASGVDINRNFDTDNWLPWSTYRGRRLSSGDAPFSEPESRIVRTLFDSFDRGWFDLVVITLHSKANSIFQASDDDYNLRFAAYLRENSSYKAVYDYPTTGDLERWLAEKHGIASATVEFKTKTDPDNLEVEELLKSLFPVNLSNDFYAKEAPGNPQALLRLPPFLSKKIEQKNRRNAVNVLLDGVLE